MNRSTAPASRRLLVPALAVIMVTSCFPLRPGAVAQTDDLSAAGATSELALEDGSGALCTVVVPDTVKGQPGQFAWANKLTPPAYPSTLRTVTVGFNRGGPVGREVERDSLYRIVVYKDPEMDGPGSNQQPDATFMARVRGTQSVMTFNLITPVTIEGGSFVVAVIDEFGIADLPNLYFSPGKSMPPGSESFITFNGGGLWQKVSDALVPDPPCGAGSFLIRATVEASPFEEPTVTKIQDPLAVEPWGVTALGDEVFVTNYVSDNLTVIRPNNSFVNVPVGDGPGGTPDGPFGVATGVNGAVFVTLFGSNVIPSKEFPIDYSAVGPGRVLRLNRGPSGFVQAATINVGRGPMFPAAIPNTTKLYVPVAGDNRIDIVNMATNLKVGEIAVGSQPSSVTLSVTNAKAYVTNFGDGTVSVIDTATDRKIKDIPAPQIPVPQLRSLGTPPELIVPTNPWQGAVSATNGNLYVTYWGTQGTERFNGLVVEFDTCSDEFERAIIDDAAAGSAPGSAGASGIVAPAAPLTRDPATGMTTGAGGGGGGPFGITAFPFGFVEGNPPNIERQPVYEPNVLFTNDALGTIAGIDARIDQVVTAPAIKVASCPKPRGLAAVQVPNPSSVPTHRLYVACGQPDNAVLVIAMPRIIRGEIPGFPVITEVKPGSKLKIKGTGFVAGTRIEVIEPGVATCFALERAPAIKKNGRLFEQKGDLVDGRRLRDVFRRNGTALLRLILPDDSVRLIQPPL